MKFTPAQVRTYVAANMTPITLTGGTVTSSTPVVDAAQTWNSGGVTFTGMKLNVTDTASATASLLADLQVGGTSQFSVRKDGRVTINGQSSLASIIVGTAQFRTGSILIGWSSNGGAAFGDGAITATYGRVDSVGMAVNDSLGIGWATNMTTTAFNTQLTRVAAGVVGVRGSSSSAGAALNFLEQTAPSAPSSNQVVLYAEDNGSGKTRLMALFPTGAAQQVAIEP